MTEIVSDGVDVTHDATTGARAVVGDADGAAASDDTASNLTVHGRSRGYHPWCREVRAIAKHDVQDSSHIPHELAAEMNLFLS